MTPTNTPGVIATVHRLYPQPADAIQAAGRIGRK